MAIGTALYVPAALPELIRIDTGRIHAWVWIALVCSSILALNVSYLIWYTSVQRIGNIRTSVYSNVTPLVAMAVAAVFLGEYITWYKAGGAAAILLGVVITRQTTGRHPSTDPPAEE